MNRAHSRDALIPVADMSALIARLEAAEVGSRELDAVVVAVFQGDGFKAVGEHVCGMGAFFSPQRVTTSLDAAIALAERVLPGYLVNLCQSEDRWDVSLDSEDDIYAHGAHAKTAPLALCVAILRATHRPDGGAESVGVNQADQQEGGV